MFAVLGLLLLLFLLSIKFPYQLETDENLKLWGLKHTHL